jgi:hypothetical protein
LIDTKEQRAENPEKGEVRFAYFRARPKVASNFCIHKLILVSRMRAGCTSWRASMTALNADRIRLEGIVSKRRDASYRSGKQCGWVKVKCATWRKANKERWRLFERSCRR